MRLAYLFFILFLTACSHGPIDRSPASMENDFVFADFDPSKSSVRVFPEVDEAKYKFYFFVELKDSSGKFVDCEDDEFSLRDPKGQNVPFKIDRVLRGRYYLTLEEKPRDEELKLNLSVRKVQLKQNLKLFLKKADRNKSFIKLVRPERGGLKLKLFLGDSKGKGVELPAPPEIILNGLGTVENLVHVGEGTWEFDLVFPDDNAVIYISVRAHGKFIPEMYRVQHIEK